MLYFTSNKKVEVDTMIRETNKQQTKQITRQTKDKVKKIEDTGWESEKHIAPLNCKMKPTKLNVNQEKKKSSFRFILFYLVLFFYAKSLSQTYKPRPSAPTLSNWVNISDSFLMASTCSVKNSDSK